MLDRIKTLALTGAFAVAGLSGAAQAESPILVELFTSQGCSSCPPADALAEKYAATDDILPLALHVDYWDYLGWKDSFAAPDWTARQYAYAHEEHSQMVFTPQMVIDGTRRVIGSKVNTVGMALADAREDVELIKARLEEGVVYLSSDEDHGPMHIELVRYLPRAEVEIAAGENAGRRMTYVNIVTAWDRLGTWDSGGPSLAIELPELDEHAALIVQAPGPGAVHAVLRIAP